MDVLTILAVNLGVGCGAMLVLWLACVAMKDVTVIDSWWALGMVLLAGSTYLQSSGAPERRLLLLGLCAAWGLRLGGYLLWRWRGHGMDRRYKAILGHAHKERGWGFAKASLLGVDYDAVFDRRLEREYEKYGVIVNARAACESELLEEIMDRAMRSAAQSSGAYCRVFATECFGMTEEGA